MEKYTLKEDIHLICVRATSFPDGVGEAFQKLEQNEASIANRKFFGISRGSDKGIIYWAAVEEAFKGEAYTFGLEQYVVKKGVYATKIVENINGNEGLIGKTFNKLLSHLQLDPMGECVERYERENEVLCMVRILE